MTFLRRPRVFLSYRHEERKPGLLGDGYNRRHREWVEKFAHALGAWNVDVIWDARLHNLFRPHTSVDPARLEFLAEVSTLCLQAAQAFMPVITAGYVERIARNDKKVGVVTEEWTRAVAEYYEARVDIVPIIREWPTPHDVHLPPEVMGHKAWDFRFVAPDKDEVELLGDSLHHDWNIERPSIDQSFAGLISGYLKFCVNEYKLPWPGVERWGTNLFRAKNYVDYMHNLQKHWRLKGEGQSRDSMEAGLGALEEEPRDEAFEKTREIMRNATRTVIGERSGFTFVPKPRGRASHGLYFGPTVKRFSYR